MRNNTIAILLATFIGGCSFTPLPLTRPHFSSKEQFKDYLMKGYDKDSYRLFYDDLDSPYSRLILLLKGLGYEDLQYPPFVVENGDEIAVLINPYKDKALVLSMKNPPVEITQQYEGQSQSIGFTKIKREDGTYEFIFPSGFTIDIGTLTAEWDSEKRFVCIGDYGWSSIPRSFDIPMHIYSADNSERGFTESKLTRCPEYIDIQDEKLILVEIAREQGHHILCCEIYQIGEGDTLSLKKTWTLEMPKIIFESGCFVNNVDYRSKTIIAATGRDWPYPCERYVYNFETDHLKRLMWSNDYNYILGFIEPKLLENNVQYVDLKKINR